MVARLRGIADKYLKGTKRRLTLAVLMSLLFFFLGVEWPLILVTLIGLAISLPMPKVFDSWFSRVFVAFFFWFSLIQIGALIQKYSYPAGGFGFVALFVAAAVIAVVWFARDKLDNQAPTKVFNIKDAAVMSGLIVFIVPLLLSI